MAEFADLEALIGAPHITPASVQWSLLESSLGTGLPTDYKMLADRYADLRFDDFLAWFHPGIPADPESSAKEMLDVLGPLRTRLGGSPTVDLLDDNGNRTDVPPYPVYPEPQGVLQWGMTDNGDRCLWLTQGEPDEWTILVERSGWWHFPGGLVDFLVGLMWRTVRCPLFPESFPESIEVEQLPS
jgi:hypothetical protein